MVALRRYAVLVSVLVAAFASLGFVQQPQVRFAGLEHNEEYVGLLRENADICSRIDSLSMLMADIRENFDAGRSSELLAVEGELYVLRDAHSRVVRQINDIEQEWLMANISSQPASLEASEDSESVQSADTRQFAELIRNPYFSRSLSRNDYFTLRRAQNGEAESARLAHSFADAHRELSRLKRQYDAVETEAAADSLFVLMTDAQARCREISDSLSSIWSNTFDNKTYLYDLLMDMYEHDDILVKSERRILEMRQALSRVEGEYASDVVVRYCFQKRCLVDYETDVAAAAGLTLAVDSLKRLGRTLEETLKYDFRKIPVSRRYFLEYEPLIFSSKATYTAADPVPECTVYEHGEIYRIKLGEYASKQPVSLFKGLAPVSLLRTANGMWRYYAGGYRTIEELENALLTVRRLGFRSADVAGWLDGAYADNRAEAEELTAVRYSVEISGSDTLPQAVIDLVAEPANESSITRTRRGVYVVGGLRSKELAETLADGIAALDSSLSVSVLASDGQ